MVPRVQPPMTMSDGIRRGCLQGTRMATVLALVSIGTMAAGALVAAQPSTDLIPCTPEGFTEEVRCAQHAVFENRAAGEGRKLTLDVIVLPAKEPAARRSDPVVFLAGGPGQAATSIARFVVDLPLRATRDVVFVDQRGTNGDHELRCDVPGDFDDPQGLLEPMFQVPVFERCRDALSARADLTQYSTAAAADDLAEVLTALGYTRANITGGSYGTRIGLVFMRRHPGLVRSAMLNGLAPLRFLNPLYHAVSAQNALDGLFAACRADAGCAEAFPDLEAELHAILTRLDKGPVEVELTLPETDTPVTVELRRPAFAEALRFLMYDTESISQLPGLIHRAHGGDFAPFALRAMQVNRGLREQLDLGMLLSVVCAEDVARIDRSTIDAVTGHSYLGDGRVRREMAVCDIWPQGTVPAADVAPVASDIPTLLLSGTLDPVTEPRWGDVAAEHLRNSRHLVVPGGHGVGGPCIQSIALAFLESGSVDDLDTTCVDDIRLPPFVVE